METIVALVIILFLFGIATSLFVQIGQSTFSENKIKANQSIDKYAAETARSKAFLDEELKTETTTIKRIVIDNTDSNRLVKLKFEVYGLTDNLIAYQYRLFLK